MSEQKTYTKEEVEADFFKFEKVKLICDHPGPFNKLYSQHFQNPLDGDCTVNELKDRFFEFVHYNAVD